MTRRYGVAIGALALSLPALVAGISMTSAHADAASPPVLRLKAPARQTVYGSDGRVWSDFATRLVATDAPFELRIKRASYSSPLRAYERIGGTDVALPTTLPVTFDKLGKFLNLKFTPVGNTTGKPFFRRLGACIGVDTQRIDPSAPARSDYPQNCYYNPYAIGALMGVQQGYAASVGDPWGGSPLRVRPGTFSVRISINPAWASALKVPSANRSVTSRVTVKRGTYDCGYAYRTTARGCRTTPRAGVPLQHQGPRPTARSAVTPADLPAGTPLPDLRALPATGFSISKNGDFLQFSATVWNDGPSPLVVDGFRRDGQDVMDGYQYFFDADGKQLPDYVKVGTFEWDARPTHQHWHFRQFAAYSLLPLGRTPQASGHADDVGGVDSRKEAFCLAATDAVDLAADGADASPDNTDLATACGDHSSLSTREVLAAGWGDTYQQFRAGQSFNLRGLPNACYNVWVEGNPVVHPTTGKRTLVESSTTNNQARRRICIGGTPGHRRITHIEKIGLVEEPGYADGEN